MRRGMFWQALDIKRRAMKWLSKWPYAAPLPVALDWRARRAFVGDRADAFREREPSLGGVRAFLKPSRVSLHEPDHKPDFLSDLGRKHEGIKIRLSH